MTSTNGGPGGAKIGEAKTPVAPSLNVLGQYVKDFSFENPNAPQSLMQLTKPPAINVQINVNAKPLSNTDFEVELVIEGKAENEGSLLFNVELVYAGIFRVLNVPQESIHPMVLIEFPRRGKLGLREMHDAAPCATRRGRGGTATRGCSLFAKSKLRLAAADELRTDPRQQPRVHERAVFGAA